VQSRVYMTTSKYTSELHALIVSALKENPSLASAASKAGVGLATLKSWIDKGEGGDEAFVAFALDVAEARAHLKDEILEALKVTALDPMSPQQTRAARELLSSQYPHEFRAAAPEPERKEDPEEEMDTSWLPTDELRTLVQLLEKIELGQVAWEIKERERKGVPTLVEVLEKKKGNGR